MTPKSKKNSLFPQNVLSLPFSKKKNLKISTQEKAPDRTAPTETSEPDLGSKRYHLKITVPQNDW